MMPVAGNSDPAESVDYKKKYKALKRKLKFLVYEHESFLEELKKAQRKLLKVSRDRSFLLDRLLQYEKVDDSSSDSEATASSDSEVEGPKDGAPTKKRKLSGGSSTAPLPVYNTETAAGVLGAVTFSGSLPTPPTQVPATEQPAGSLPNPATQVPVPAVPCLVSPAPPAAQTAVPPAAPEPSALLKQLSSNPSAQPTTPKSTPEPPKKRQKVTKKTPKSGGSTSGRPTVAQALQQQQQLQRQQLQRQQLQQQQQQQLASHISLADAIAPGHMTREELERHLEYKQSTKPQFMSIDKAPNMLPDDIFNDDNSFSDSDAGDRPIKEEEELVIDMQLE